MVEYTDSNVKGTRLGSTVSTLCELPEGRAGSLSGLGHSTRCVDVGCANNRQLSAGTQRD